MNHKFLLATIAILMIATTSPAQVTDRDGNNYKTVKIGNQEWMAGNLNVSHFKNGDVIPEVKTLDAWKKALAAHKPACCYYQNEQPNGKVHGRLYNWYAVNDPRGLAPKGWHVPTEADWNMLANSLGGKNIAGGKMKTTNGWAYNGNGKNESEFAATPAGYRDDGGAFSYLGQYATWWASSENNAATAWSALLEHSGTAMNLEPGIKGEGRSVRCVRD